MKNRPIGVFDSGIGGLTVAHALREALPNESLMYLGDTAHLPYGDKSDDAIRSFSLRITKFLLEKGAKAIVIACNSASSHAFDAVRELVPDEIPVFNVIDPVVESLRGLEKGIVGVIGTSATIRSHMYRSKITLANPALIVSELPTPLLAHMIEEGFFTRSVSQAVISEYLNDPALDGIDHLILACTHYPLIQDQIQSHFQKEVKILNSAELVALEVKEVLEKKNLLTNSGESNYQFFVTDFTESFDKSADHFFQGRVELEEVKLWKE